MSFWPRLFGRKELSFDEARALLKEAERLVKRDAIAAMDLMQSRRFKRIPSALIGPGGSLHGRLLAILGKLKQKVAADEQSPRKVERNFENLPSVAVLVVPRTIDSDQIIDAARTSGKKLLCLMPYGAYASPEQARRQIELSYDFADDPNLAMMIVGFSGAILIRASFVLKQASVIRARTVEDFVMQLATSAQQNGMKIKQVTH